MGIGREELTDVLIKHARKAMEVRANLRLTGDMQADRLTKIVSAILDDVDKLLESKGL